jgi:hypothetical protein
MRKLCLDAIVGFAYTIVIDNVIEKMQEEHHGRC